MRQRGRCVPDFLITFVRQVVSYLIILFTDLLPLGTQRPLLHNVPFSIWCQPGLMGGDRERGRLFLDNLDMKALGIRQGASVSPLHTGRRSDRFPSGIRFAR